METLTGILSFLSEAEKLKTVKRQNLTLDGGRPENPAEHSWHAALGAVLLGRLAPAGLDIDRVVRMLLVHDLAELATGDTWFYDDAGREAAVEAENRAAERLFAQLPEDLAAQMTEVREEFEEGASPEARFARAVDAFMPLLGHLQTAPAGENLRGLTRSRVLAKKAFIQQDAPWLWPAVLDLVDQSVARGLYTAD